MTIREHIKKWNIDYRDVSFYSFKENDEVAAGKIGINRYGDLQLGNFWCDDEYPNEITYVIE